MENPSIGPSYIFPGATYTGLSPFSGFTHASTLEIKEPQPQRIDKIDRIIPHIYNPIRPIHEPQRVFGGEAAGVGIVDAVAVVEEAAAGQRQDRGYQSYNPYFHRSSFV